jgi:hypothetical protein
VVTDLVGLGLMAAVFLRGRIPGGAQRVSVNAA